MWHIKKHRVRNLEGTRIFFDVIKLYPPVNCVFSGAEATYILFACAQVKIRGNMRQNAPVGKSVYECKTAFGEELLRYIQM
jgi:hypothetical protein